MDNIYKLKLTVLQKEILRMLSMRAGKPINARGISMALNVSQPAVSKSLPNLKEMGYIKVSKDKESKRLSIELDRENPDVIGMKRSDNLLLVYESGLYKFLYDSLPGSTVMLFGSYSTGEDTMTSDIDIAVIGSKEKRLSLERFEKILERKIFLHFYPSLKALDANLRNNILGGILLKGSVDM